MNPDLLPPHNFEAEEAIIGSLLLDDTVMRRIGTLVQPQDFFRARTRWAYEAALRVVARGDPTDPISIAEELGHGDRWATIGGAAFVAQCIATVPTSVHAEYYARLVHQLAMQRREIQRGGQIASMGFNGTPERKPRY